MLTSSFNPIQLDRGIGFMLLSAALVAILLLHFNHAVFGQPDFAHVGLHFKTASDLLAGAVPYRDTFITYGLWVHIVEAAGILFSDGSWIGVYRAVGVSLCVTYILFYLVIRRFLPGTLAGFNVFLVAMTQGLAPFPWPGFSSLLLFAGTSWTLVRWVETSRKSLLVLAGAFSALLALSEIVYLGAMAVATFALVAGWIVLATSRKARLQDSGAAVGRVLFGAIFVWALVGLYFWTTGSLHNYWQQQIIGIVDYGSQMYSALSGKSVEEYVSYRHMLFKIFTFSMRPSRVWVPPILLYGIPACAGVLAMLYPARARIFGLSGSEALVIAAATGATLFVYGVIKDPRGVYLPVFDYALLSWMVVYGMHVLGLYIAFRLPRYRQIHHAWWSSGAVIVLLSMLSAGKTYHTVHATASAIQEFAASSDRDNGLPSSLRGWQPSRSEWMIPITAIQEAIDRARQYRPGVTLIDLTVNPIWSTFLGPGNNCHPIFILYPNVRWWSWFGWEGGGRIGPEPLVTPVDFARADPKISATYNMIADPNYWDRIKDCIERDRPLVVTAGPILPEYRAIVDILEPGWSFNWREFDETPPPRIVLQARFDDPIFSSPSDGSNPAFSRLPNAKPVLMPAILPGHITITSISDGESPQEYRMKAAGEFGEHYLAFSLNLERELTSVYLDVKCDPDSRFSLYLAGREATVAMVGVDPCGNMMSVHRQNLKRVTAEYVPIGEDWYRIAMQAAIPRGSAQLVIKLQNKKGLTNFAPTGESMVFRGLAID
jgi:hypothetical protein